MTAPRRLLLIPSLLAATASLASVALGLDTDSLKLVVGELPYPNLNFEFGVTFSVRQTALLGLGDPAQLLQAADERLAADPADPAAHLDRGMALEMLSRQGAGDEYARAADLWKVATDKDPENVDALLGLAKARVQMDQLPDATPVLQSLADKHPDLWWPHYALARQAMGEFSDLVVPGGMSAVAPAGAKGDTEPDDSHLRMQQVADNALMHIEDALQASPDEPAPRVLRALIQMQVALWGAMRTGEPPEASVLAEVDDALRGVAQDCPDEPQIQAFARWTTVSRSLARAGGGDDLAGLWHRLSPEDQRMLAQDELSTNAMLSQEAGRIPDTYELLAVYAMLHGNDREALDRLAESARQDPTSGERWEAYIGAVTRTGDLGRIETVLREALQHIDNGKLRSTLAKVHQKRGELGETEQELLAAIEMADDHAPFAQLMLGILKLKRGDAEAATEPLQAAAETWHQGGLAHAALALALALAGRQDEAAEHIAKAREMEPDQTLYARAADIIGG